MSKKTLLIKPVNEVANEFYKNHSTFNPGDSGVDLFVLEDIEFMPGETKLIDLGIQTEVKSRKANHSYYLFPRSSISKTPLRLANSVGIIDAGYRGNLKAAFTFVPTFQDLNRILSVGSLDCFPPYKVEKGSRLVQICSNDLEPFSKIKLVKSLSETERGEGGFGSTGK